MKILLVNTVCGTGSTGRILSDLYAKYRAEGHEVKIIYGRGVAANVEPKDAFCFNSKLDLYYHALMSRLWDKQGFYSKTATYKMIDYIKDFQPDVIHLHNIHGYFLNYPLFFSYLNTTNIKIVWTLHDCWPFTGHCAYFLYNQCDQWQKDCMNCEFYKDYPTAMFGSKSASTYLLKKQLLTENKHLTLITPSAWLADLVSKSFLSDKKTVVIHNGVDTDIFQPRLSDIKQKLGISNQKKIVLGVALPWTERKGYQYFLALNQKIDHSKIQIVLVGLSEKQLKTLPKDIVGIKRTDSAKQLAELYAMADVLFNPTLEDNYPTVNLEALSSGTPVLCFSATGGGAEIIKETNGIVLKSRDMNSILDGIDAIEKANFKIDTKQFDKKNMLEQYCDLINQII